jgi:hypothetical protein
MTILASAIACIAGGDQPQRLANRHGVDRDAHGAVAQTKCHRGLHVARHGLARMADGADGTGARMGREQRRKLRLIPREQETRAGVPLGDQRHPGDDHGRRIVSAHGVDRQGKSLRRGRVRHLGRGGHDAGGAARPEPRP